MHSSINIFNMTLPTYGVIVLLGLMAVLLIGMLVVWHCKLCMETYFRLAGFGGTVALIGAKLLYMLEAAVETGELELSEAAFRASGISFYGGLIGGAAGVYITALILHADAESYARKLIFLVPLLHAIWKLGCFMGGCCFGIPYSGIGAVIFPDGANVLAGVPVFPVQLLEAATLLVMAVVFYVRGRGRQLEVVEASAGPINKPGAEECSSKIQCAGQGIGAENVGTSATSGTVRALRHTSIAAEYIGCYALVRFFTEFLRYHEDGGILSAAQWISVFCVLTVLLYGGMVRKSRNSSREYSENQMSD